MYEDYTQKDIFIIKARCLTVGIDFYKKSQPIQILYLLWEAFSTVQRF